MSEENKAAVRRFVELWNTAGFDRFGEVVDEGFVWRSLADEERVGLATYISRASSVTSDDNRLRIDIDDIVAEGDRVAVRLSMYRGGEMYRRTHDIFRVENGKIVEEWSGHA
jgi:predicted ester cyclase